MPVSEPLHAVGALIEGVKAVEHWSDEQLAERANERGFTISRPNINRMRNRRPTSVSLNQINTLAVALNVPPARVAQAYFEAFGFPIQTSSRGGVVAAISDAGALNSDDKELLTVLYQTMVKQSKRRDSTKVQDSSEADVEVVDGGIPVDLPEVQTASPRGTYVHQTDAGETDGEGANSEVEQSRDREVRRNEGRVDALAGVEDQPDVDAGGGEGDLASRENDPDK